MFRLKRTPVFLFLVFLSALSHAQSTQPLSLFQTFTGVDYIKTSTGQIPPPFDIVGIKLLQLRLDRQPELHLIPPVPTVWPQSAKQRPLPQKARVSTPAAVGQDANEGKLRKMVTRCL